MSNGEDHDRDVAAATGPVNSPDAAARVAIVTRPAEDAGALMDRLTAAGWRAILSPAMEIRFQEASMNLEGVAALAFTSANGVRAFAANTSVRNLPAFTVGAATAEAARSAGFEDIRSADGDVIALGRLIGAAAETGEVDGAVLHVAGTHRAGDLARDLEARGVNCRRVVLYEAQALTRPSAEACAAVANAAATETAVILFSPRTARLFLDQLERAGLSAASENLIAMCLSPAVAEAASGAPWRAVRTADAPTAESFYRLLR